MQFWNSLLTEKSWDILIELNKKPIKFILIGGWANYLWTKLHKSKDIDIILEDFNSLNYLKQNYNLTKNDNLKKYEIKIEEIDVDIYVAHYSELGIPINEIKKHTTKIENITVVRPEILLILKQTAEKQRQDSIKGQKDRIDILTLVFNVEIDFKEYNTILEKDDLNHYYNRLLNIITNFKEIKYLELNPRQFKLKKQQLLKKLKSAN
ncbi:hypothetical protein JXB41_07660 [Candidatus Woesearchaeota archaeon]|nr:hypothetical protein [Candidatus Woesearchaeota archaeon]